MKIIRYWKWYFTFFSAYNVEEEKNRKLTKKYHDKHIPDKKYYALDFGLYKEK